MKRQKNYTNRLYRRELKKYVGNLDLKSLTDNRKFWDILLPLLSSKGKSSRKITLVENEEIVADDTDIANRFSKFFIEAVSSLGIEDNKSLLNNVDDLEDPVQKAIHKFKDHPSICETKKNESVENIFNFKKIDAKVMLAELRALNPKKSGTSQDIPVRILKQEEDIVIWPLTEIWNVENFLPG